MTSSTNAQCVDRSISAVGERMDGTVVAGHVFFRQSPPGEEGVGGFIPATGVAEITEYVAWNVEGLILGILRTGLYKSVTTTTFATGSRGYDSLRLQFDERYALSESGWRDMSIRVTCESEGWTDESDSFLMARGSLRRDRGILIRCCGTCSHSDLPDMGEEPRWGNYCFKGWTDEQLKRFSYSTPNIWEEATMSGVDALHVCTSYELVKDFNMPRH
jgi:hypothetical protein